VRYERFEIQTATSRLSLALHPRLTVLAGLGTVEREELIDGFIGALGTNLTGIRAVITQDSGRRLTVSQPEAGHNYVVDVDRSREVTDEFTDGRSRIDLVGHGEIGLHRARRVMRLGARDLAAGTQDAAESALVRRLADVEPEQLWAAAECVRRTEDDLGQVVEAVGSAPEDGAAIDKVEQRHRELEAAQLRHGRMRRRSIGVAIICAAVGIPLAFLSLPAGAALLLSAAVTLLVSFALRSSGRRAADAQAKALADAGAESYLEFRLQPVNGLLSSDQNRKLLRCAAEAHALAIADWKSLAGDIEVGWALEHRDEIVGAARLRHDMSALGAVSSTAPDMEDDRSTELARALVGRLRQLRHFGRDGESFPLILDDPFVGLDAGMQSAVLDLLQHLSGSPQIIFLTQDEDVASWARLEALTGALSLVEPANDQAAPMEPEGRDTVTI